MNIRWIRGDLIKMAKEGEFTAIAHGANCFGTMGSGIAPQMNKLTDGRLLAADKRTPIGDINKLGMFSFVETFIDGQSLEVYNLYTQFVYGKNIHGIEKPVLVSWHAFSSALCGMIKNARDPSRIGIPFIGCGLAGGRIEDFIQSLNTVKEEFEDRDIELVVVEYGKA